MIIVDFNNIIFSTVSLQFNKTKLSESLLRHMTLNCLRSYRSKYGEKFGELVLVADDAKYWRRERFPYYKANRKKAREESGLDWATIFKAMDNIKSELKTVFPYPFVTVESAEADDIIAVITKTYSRFEPIMIMGADTDFVQLHDKNVKQYDPVRKRWIKQDNPELYLRQHIIEGDRSDGIPNIRSPDDTFVSGARQRAISKEQKDIWAASTPEALYSEGRIDPDVYRNFIRNRELIDLNYVPESIKLNILDEYEKQNGKDKSRKHLFNYFFEKKLTNLIGQISDF